MSENITTLDLGFVNAYLLKTKGGFVLVDTGMPTQWETLQERLESAGCSPGFLRLVVLTHGDLDHAGNCVHLKESYNVPIAAHTLESAALQTEVSPKRAVRTWSAKLGIGLLRVLRRFAGGAVKPQAFTPDVLLEDGQSLASYGLAARVLHLPGHTKGSIALLTDQGGLLAGDVFTNRKNPAPSPYVENLEEYRRSLEKVKQLADAIKVVYPGHGAVFSGEQLSALSL